MRKFNSLYFTSDSDVSSSEYNSHSETSTILFNDGSDKAISKMHEFLTSDKVNHSSFIKTGLCITPTHELKIMNDDGILSKPNYAYGNDAKLKWFCSKVVSPSLEVQDITKKMHIEKKVKDNLCYVSYRLWSLLKVIEDRLCFPAVIIDRLLQNKEYLNSFIFDLEDMRASTGIAALDYNPSTDMISIEIAGDIEAVKLSVLNKVCNEIILPFFNSLYGNSSKLNMNIYGEIGRQAESLMTRLQSRPINNTSPMLYEDLISFSEKVRLSDKNCIWIESRDDIEKSFNQYTTTRLSLCDGDEFVYQ